MRVAAPLLGGLALVTLTSCSGSSGSTSCSTDADGIVGGSFSFVLTVDDTGFSKNILASQNDATVTLKLTNTGTRPHGFKVGCVTVTAPEGCPTQACFPADAAIAPLAPGASQTITFATPTPDNLLYPFTSNEPADADVEALHSGQWSLM